MLKNAALVAIGVDAAESESRKDPAKWTNSKSLLVPDRSVREVNATAAKD